MLQGLGMPGPLVVHLDVPTDVLLRRLTLRRQCENCGAIYTVASVRCQADGGALVERDDDNQAVVSRRLAAYATDTLPVVEYYRKREVRQGIYRRIDGSLSTAEIANEIGDLAALADTALAA